MAPVIRDRDHGGERADETDTPAYADDSARAGLRPLDGQGRNRAAAAQAFLHREPLE